MTRPDIESAGGVALVTGGARGIGRAIVELLLEQGWRVAAADIDTAALEEIGALDGVLPVHCDVSDQASVTAAVGTTVQALGGLDLVVNNAGIGSFLSVRDVSLDEWNRVWAINVTSILLLGKAAHPHLAASGQGAIVNVASDASFRGMRDRAAYCTTKGAVVSLTMAMAADFIADGIRVNAVSPSAVDSEWLRQRGLGDAELAAAKAQLATRVPMGRLAVPSDIAQAVVWLGSPAAGYITGQSIVIDGGANTLS